MDIAKRVVTRAPDAPEDEQPQDELEEYHKVFIGEARARPHSTPPPLFVAAARACHRAPLYSCRRWAARANWRSELCGARRQGRALARHRAAPVTQRALRRLAAKALSSVWGTGGRLAGARTGGRLCACIGIGWAPALSPARAGAQIPIMLRSSFCSLFDHSDKELTDLGECPYDQVRPAAPTSHASAFIVSCTVSCNSSSPHRMRAVSAAERHACGTMDWWATGWTSVGARWHGASRARVADGARAADGARGAARAQGGYFVVNGSEKVLIAQERMANNHVYVFRKSQPGKYAVTAECRSVIEGSTRNTSSMSIKMLSRAAGRSGGQARARPGAAAWLRDGPVAV